MVQREIIEAALHAWRNAERQLARAVDGEAEALAREVELHRDEFQRLSAEIWEAVRSSEEHAPETTADRRRSPRPTTPGVA